MLITRVITEQMLILVNTELIMFLKCQEQWIRLKWQDYRHGGKGDRNSVWNILHMHICKGALVVGIWKGKKEVLYTSIISFQYSDMRLWLNFMLLVSCQSNYSVITYVITL